MTPQDTPTTNETPHVHAGLPAAAKVRFATVWLDGCSGCHMSFLDIDQRLLEIAPLIDLVYSPLVDVKEYPQGVDVALVEGAVSTDEDVEKIKHIRARTKVLVALGDCAAIGNVPSMRNKFDTSAVCERAYVENVTLKPGMPDKYLPKLLDRVLPVGQVVKVDVYIPGCPPSADTIFKVVCDLLTGKTPQPMTLTRFGA